MVMNGDLKNNPTISAGDFTISKDGGAAANLTNLPTVVGTSAQVEISLTATEMTADKVFLQWHDPTNPQEWVDGWMTINTTAAGGSSNVNVVTWNGHAVSDTTPGLPDVNAATVGDKTGYALTSAYDFSKGTIVVPEGYAADGAAFTPIQALYMLWSLFAERSIVGTTLTAKKLDGSTTSMTFTLDSATTPTSQTRST